MRFSIRVFFYVACAHFFQSPAVAQTSQKIQKQLFITKRVIELNHYSPKPVNDHFSNQVFIDLIERLDENKLYFTEADIKELSVYSTQLDDELNGKGWSFFDKLQKLYKQKLLKADSIIINILKNPFDLSSSETIVLMHNSLHYATSNDEYNKRWQKWLKYQVLEELANILSSGGTDKKSVLQKEPIAREKVKASELRNIKKILDHQGGYEHYLASIICDVIANYFDPHTEYMPLDEKQSFESELGTEGYYFGLSVKENDKGEIEIVRLMPGSPAWKCGELNKGDILLKLAWEGKDSVDLRGATQEEVSELLQGPANRRMWLTVRKANGLEKTASLMKEKITNEDNTVKGFLLKGDKRIGYIYLPDFYTDMEGNLTASSANDVAKEIVKLKKENIEGLILDVRYNGGGSLREALDMAGIFIDEGPLCMIKDRNGKVSSLKDLNRGTIYDGPLVLLINGQSASASELLGAVLQDYNRAIVVGGSTYGKGTAQIILPVDTTATAHSGSGEHGFIKVTTSKFYRVNGNTTQHQGVKPDVTLPDIFDGLNYKESAVPNALPPDTVKRNAYYKPLVPLPLNEITAKSSARTKSHAGFGEIETYISLLKNSGKLDSHPVSLKWDNYIADFMREQSGKESLPFSQKSNSSQYIVQNNSFDLEKLQADPFLAEINAAWLNKIVQDIYVEEAFLILVDHITLVKK
jgi:carboxyl-terminal processing protease